MPASLTNSKTIKRSKIIFLLSILVSVFWILGQAANIYHFTITGVIYEMLWLPMLVMLVLLPAISLLLLFKEKFNIKSLYLYSILVIGLTILISVTAF